jgi:cytochrome c peroxidase
MPQMHRGMTVLRACCAAAVLCGMLSDDCSACSFARRRRELRGGHSNFTLPPGHPFVPSADVMAALRRIARREVESGSDEYAVIRAEIRYILENPVDPVTGLPDPFYDDGSYAPIALRLAWHAAADWDPDPPPGEPRGGSQGGASMRFEPGRSYEENRGLELPRLFLEPIRLLNPQLSYSDLWVLAGYEAVETLGGPRIEFRPGRVDVDEGGANCPPEERLPAAMDSTESIRAKFARMELGPREQVALMGGHTVGRPHAPWPYRSWDNSPVRFNNQYFDFVLGDPYPGEQWIFVEGAGTSRGLEWWERRGWLQMLPDMFLRDEERYRATAEEFREDEGAFWAEFARSFKQLTEAGMPVLVAPAQAAGA